MTPIAFDDSNDTLKPPEGMTEKECRILSIHRDMQNGVLLSCWKMTWRERLSALFFGRAWLHVMSFTTQPPVKIEVQREAFVTECGLTAAGDVKEFRILKRYGGHV